VRLKHGQHRKLHTGLSPADRSLPLQSIRVPDTQEAAAGKGAGVCKTYDIQRNSTILLTGELTKQQVWQRVCLQQPKQQQAVDSESAEVSAQHHLLEAACWQLHCSGCAKCVLAAAGSCADLCCSWRDRSTVHRSGRQSELCPQSRNGVAVLAAHAVLIV
jgi:hypothetical protein